LSSRFNRSARSNRGGGKSFFSDTSSLFPHLNHVADHVADQHTSYNIGSSNGSAAQSFS
jgi:hypothetical protein